MNNRITPFVKRMRTNGGTIYTFSSAVEDIGLNINERNNIVKISNFALLNIPKIDLVDDLTAQENKYNVNAISGAFFYNNNGAAIKDGRVLIAESFENYALNLESNFLNQTSYDATLQTTVSERVFWKWLKETGAIRWNQDSSGNWTEEPDSDSSLGYNSVVKYFGQVSAGNVRSDSFGTYNETYILVPTSHGQMLPYFKQVEDVNYHHGMEIGNLGENILGREGYTKPQPDGLDFRAYYDFMDSSTTNTTYNTFYDASALGVFKAGWWYSAEGRNPIYPKNSYLTDSNSYLTTGQFSDILKYQSGPTNIQFRRSRVDCMSLVWDLGTLKTIVGDPQLTYDKMAINYAINDTFEFNAALIYYTVYNSTQDTILATNLLGILFIDAPSGNSSNIGFGGIVIPSLEKIQSGPGGFGTSYSLRLNIKTDNMVDDTTATIIDAATSDQLNAQDWSEAFFQLDRAVNILTQNNSTLSFIATQYNTLQNVQVQMLNDLKILEAEVNNMGGNIQGTNGTIALISDGPYPIIDSSIHVKDGNIGFFNTDPSWPIQMDASLKTKDIYIEKAIRDIEGNILLGYGSPLQIGSSTNDRAVKVYSNGPTPRLTIDLCTNVDGNINIDGSIFVFGVPFIGGGGGGDASQITYHNPSYPTVEAALDQLLYVAPLVTLTGGSTFEIGQTINSVALNWTINKNIISQSINQGIGSLDPSLRTFTHSAQTITTDRTYTITVNDGTNSATSSSSVLFRNKRFWGTSTLTSLTDAQIKALSSEFATSFTQSRTFDCTGGKYFYFAFPASFGTPSFKVGGLAFSDMTLVTRAFVNASGFSSSYNIYRVTNLQSGSAIAVDVL
jgi:hypothetical protein